MKNKASLIRHLLLPVLLALAFPISAQTTKEDAIDIAYNDCLLKDTSSGNIDACAFIAYGKWNKELDHAYDRLMKELRKSKDKAALKQSQTAWKAYRDAEFTSYDNMFNCPGNKWCMRRQNGRIDIVKARVLQLRSYYESMKKD
jgi:uncharacterized protein YecT (DUF1311 family)